MNAPAALRNPITPWENIYWVPETVYAGQTVFCLASGPSLTLEIVRKLVGRSVIVVNSSYRLTVEAGITDATLFFTDSGWYNERKDLVANWPGLVVSLSRQAKRELDDPTVNKTKTPRILRPKMVGAPPFPPMLPGHRQPGFPPAGSPEVQQGRSSGHTAVAVAIAMGAKRVMLLGYDMQVVNGREHCHDEYAGQKRDLEQYEREFQDAFKGWQAAAEASGVEILNCTHGSAVKEFPFADLDEVLACDRS